MRKQRKAKWSPSKAFVMVVVFLVGALCGVVIDQRLNPLSPDVCDARLARLDAPIVAMDFVCHGKLPPSR